MRWVLFTFIVLAAAILEAGNLSNLIALHEGQIRPSALIILLVFVSTHAHPQEAVIASFGIGLAADLAGSVMGPFTVCCGLAGSFLAQTQGFLSVRRPVHQLFVVFMAALFILLCSHWLSVLKTSRSAGFAFSVLTGCALYSAGAAPILWPLLNLLWKYLNKPLPGRTPGSRISHV